MERDFLGINGNKDAGPQLKDDARGNRQDPGFLGGSVVQWPFSSSNSSLQKFMSFKAAQEERSKKTVFEQHSSSGFQPIATVDAFDANHKSSTVVTPQKCFGLERQGIHPSQNSDCFGSGKHPSGETQMFSVGSHHSMPVATSSPFFKVNGSPNLPNMTACSLRQQPFGGGIATSNPVLSVGAFTSRYVSKPSPTTAQLTIFYAGSVNVYDNVPLDKAQAIMFLASSGSNSMSTTMNPRPETSSPVRSKLAGVDGVNINQTPAPTPNQVMPSCSGLSSPISLTSHTEAQSVSCSSKADDMAGAKTIGGLAPSGQHEASKTMNTALGSASTVTIMTRAVPQARKASLARFLEKRKERVTSAMPYSCANKSTEDSKGPDVTNLSSKVSSPDAALSSNTERSWCLGQPKNSIYSRESPCTKLEM